MSRIPVDVITDTLYQLPVKTLLRFRALCKPLSSLIDDPDFIKRHLTHSISTKSHLTLILKGLHLYFVNLPSLDKAIPLVHYPETIWGGTEVFGSCNGLLALSNSDHDIALFNPSTRESFKLPVSHIQLPNESCIRSFVFLGFGYDHVNDDYKVVRMVRFKQDEDDNLGCFLLEYEVKVFSLKNKSWRTITNLPFYLRFMFQFYYHLMHRRGYGVYACGVLHWVLPRRPELGVGNLVVAFDLVAEEFRLLSQPDYGVDVEKDCVLEVGVLEGQLCVMYNFDQVKVDLWVMKEYGVKESWTKLLSIGQCKMIGSITSLKPLIYSNDSGLGNGSGKILLEVNGGELVWYDWNRKRFKTVRIKEGPDSYGTYICVESLVPLTDGGHGTDEKKKQKQQEKRKQNRKWNDFLSKGFKLAL